jgi:UDP-3-O-[3-hydroxymyristoyl] N-acetylglucosamine deacetylase
MGHSKDETMDGLPYTFPLQSVPTVQRSLRSAIDCVGVGVHSGRKVRLVLRPAPAGSGIVFRRDDLGVDIPARFDCVVETRLCTMLARPEQPEVRVGTVEHVMAALAGAGVHNAVVQVDGPEVPVLDGSAANFLFLIDCAGIEEQGREVPEIELARTVRVESDGGFAELRPAPFGFDMALSIDFDAPAIGRQAFSLRLSPESFRRELACARTFALAHEIEQLRSAGLARGGNLSNAVVVDHARVLNPGGLRMPDEFVRHKLLDVVGDLALAGGALRGRFVGHRSGHTLNNQLLRALFADATNWRPCTSLPLSPGQPPMAGWQEARLPVAAAPL